jgi:uncharacterized protein (TIGR03032 family)
MASLPPAAEPQLELTGSRQFTSWLAEQRASLAFTTYQSGKLFLIGLREDARLSVFERTFNRCMGMWASAQTLYVSTLYQLWRFENALAPGERHEGYDRLYVPRMAWTTGDIDVHDVAVDGEGAPGRGRRSSSARFSRALRGRAKRTASRRSGSRASSRSLRRKTAAT